MHTVMREHLPELLNEAPWVVGEGVLTYLAAEGERRALPCRPRCHGVGMQKQPAHWVGFPIAVGITTANLKKTDRIGDAFEPSRR